MVWIIPGVTLSGSVADKKLASSRLRGGDVSIWAEVQKDFFNNPALMHEYFHVMKQWEPLLLTSGRYVLEWLRSGYFEQSV